MLESDFDTGDGGSDPLSKPKSHFGSRNWEGDPSVPISDCGSGDGGSDLLSKPKLCFGSGDWGDDPRVPKSDFGSGDGRVSQP